MTGKRTDPDMKVKHESNNVIKSIDTKQEDCPNGLNVDPPNERHMISSRSDKFGYTNGHRLLTYSQIVDPILAIAHRLLERRRIVGAQYLCSRGAIEKHQPVDMPRNADPPK
jgi:hypothetical protein